MPLSAGDKLGPYEVLSLLGQGGMGEVYRARDTTLQRDVALKVLPAMFLRDPERMARFQREAQVLASLDHPNIGHIHGTVDSEDLRGLVLALIEGPTLADRIEAGPLPRDEAIGIAKQIIEALEYAHDSGVIHRDLKPANVKITPEGVVKVLDFGLAKVLEDEPPPSSLANSPTLTLGHTRAGVILGTAAYMSPEQAVGRPVDRRSDIFSFGAVLFEMLTGKRAFAGATTPDVLEAVVKHDPDWSALPAGIPGYLRNLLERTLAKDRKQRLQAIGEARIVLEHPQRDEPAQAAPSSIRRFLPWAIAAIAVLAFAIPTFRHFTEPNPEEPAAIQTDIALPDGVTIPLPGNKRLAFSPDGSRLAFQGLDKDGQSHIWIRNMQTGSTVEVPGTERSAGSINWTPDGQWLTFDLDGRVVKVEANGGTARPLAAGAWIIWSPGDLGVLDVSGAPAQRISLSSGAIQPLLQFDSSVGETGQTPSAFLPDGRRFLFSSTQRTGRLIRIGSLDGKVIKDLVPGNPPVEFVSRAPGSTDGWFLYSNQGQIFARPFDLNKLDFTGSEQVLASDVASGPAWTTAGRRMLAYQRGGSARSQLGWYSRDGKRQSIVATGIVSTPRISPDQRRIAFARGGATFVHEIARGLTRQLSKEAGRPIWTRTADSLFIDTTRNGFRQTFEVAADGSGAEKLFYEKKGTTNRAGVGEVSRDGKRLILLDDNAIFLVSRTDGQRVPFSKEFLGGSFSPDGRWIVVSLGSSVAREVFALPVPVEAGGAPGLTSRVQISTNGGKQPRWSDDGREIFYVSGDLKMISVPVETGPKGELKPGLPKELFQTTLTGTGEAQYDVSLDGQRFLIAQSPPDAASEPLTVISNWQKLLK